MTQEEVAALADLRVAGGDAGVATPMALCTGEMLGGAVLDKGEEKRLARLQRSVARKEEALRAVHGRKPGASLKGLEIPKSLSRARARAGRFWGRIIRRRRDMVHKITTWLTATFDVIALEDLAIGDMTSSARGDAGNPGRNVRQKAGLNRGILDRGGGELKRQLAYKMARASRRRGAKKILLRVDPAYTSQTCFACRSVDSDSRQSQSVLACTVCGHADHADTNAARNIREGGLEEIARTCGLALGDLPDVLLERPGPVIHGSRGRIETEGGSPVVTIPLAGPAPCLLPGAGPEKGKNEPASGEFPRISA